MKSSIIRRTFLLIAIIVIGNVSVAQNVPDWYNETSRGHLYPENTYYTGLAYAEVSYSSSEGEAIRKAEQAAKADALSKILVSVKSQTLSSSLSVTIDNGSGVDEQYMEQFSSLTQIDVIFKDVPGLQCQHWRNGATVTAFAYVRKAELARYYDRRITSLLTKIESTLDNADELVRHGEKIKARNMAQTAIQYIAELENAQRILMAVSNDADIQADLAVTLSRRLVALLSELKNSTAIYLDCKAIRQGESYTLFSDNIKGTLSKMGVSFVDSKGQADWVITVNADVVRENDAYGSFFVWVDGDISVLKKATNQVVYSSSLSSMEDYSNGIKGGHTAGYEQATRNAYTEAARVVAKKILEFINQ